MSQESGDIELNPASEQNLKSQTILSVGSTMLLNLRLCQLGLPVTGVRENRGTMLGRGTM